MVLLDHLVEENVINLDVVSRYSVVQEVRGEHHSVSLEPELGAILVVEFVNDSVLLEGGRRQKGQGGEDVHEQSSVIKRSIALAEEPRSDGSHEAKNLVLLDPEEVDHSPESVEGVSAVLSLAHLDGLEESSNATGSLGQFLIH